MLQRCSSRQSSSALRFVAISIRRMMSSTCLLAQGSRDRSSASNTLHLQYPYAQFNEPYQDTSRRRLCSSRIWAIRSLLVGPFVTPHPHLAAKTLFVHYPLHQPSHAVLSCSIDTMKDGPGHNTSSLDAHDGLHLVFTWPRTLSSTMLDDATAFIRGSSD
jgi:hypothetical protein